MKTIFYKQSKNKDGDYWFDNKPYVEWFTLEKTLYEPNGSIVKRTIIEKEDKRYVHSVANTQIQETFSDDGIVRRIALYVSNS